MKKITSASILLLQAAVGLAQNIPTSSSTSAVVTSIPGSVTNEVPLPDYSVASHNFTRLFVPQYPIADASAITADAPNTYLKYEVIYQNGFGKAIQDIKKYASSINCLITPYDLRPSKTRYSFLPYPSTLSTDFRTDAFTAQRSFYNAKFPAEGNTAVSETMYGSDVAKRYTYDFAPGKSNIGQSHGVRTVTCSNAPGEVIMWSLDSDGKPQKVGYYPKGSLVKKNIETADGGQVFEYYDDGGKLICRNILADFHTCSLDGTQENAEQHAASAAAYRMFMPLPDSTQDSSGSSFQQNDTHDSTGITDGTNGNSSPILSNRRGPSSDEVYNEDAINEEIKMDPKMAPTNHFNFECPTFLMTYYVYDIYDRPVYTLYPKACEYMYENAWIATDAVLDNLCDHLTYDDMGRLVQKHTAGEVGDEMIVYDKHQRPVMTQKPGENKWHWTHYDKFDRVIQSGDYTSGVARTTLQNFFDVGTAYSSGTLSLFYYLINDLNQGVYIDHNLTSPAVCEVNTFNFYDKYDNCSYFDGSAMQPISFSYDPSIFSGREQTGPTAVISPSSAQTRIDGQLAYKVTKVMKPYAISGMNDYIASATYYDKYGREIEVRTKNAYGDLDTRATQFDFTGRLLTSIATFNNHNCAADPTTTTTTRYHYNLYTMKLGSITHSINGGIERPIVSSTYNSINQLQSRNIGDVEYQKLDYNIKGLITGINGNYAETGNTDGQSITFGESIKYDAGFTNTLFCGNVSGIIWKSEGQTRHAYGYTYDRSGRLKQADFTEYSPDGSGTTTWNNTVMDYTEGNITYDYNGNIQKLKRYGQIATTPGLIDDLTYVYNAAGVSNRLESITDAVSPSTTTDVTYDFKDNNTGSEDYSFDDMGRMQKDMNKDVTATVYDQRGLPVSLTFGNGDVMDIIRDAEGNKIQERYTNASGTTTTDYNGSISYKDGLLYKIDNPEGYSSKGSAGFDYFYYVKDHLGNVRNILNSYETPWVLDYNATHETGYAGVERMMFSNIDQVSKDKPFTLDQLDLKAAMLDASDPDRTIGTAIVLKVMGGDRFDISANSFYSSADTAVGDTGDSSLVSSLLASLTGGIHAGGGDENGNIQILRSMFGGDNVKLADVLNQTAADESRPQAFINYILYDECFRIIPECSGRIQLAEGADKWSPVGTGSPINITRSGYLSIFLSTSSTHVTLGFDDLNIHHYMGTVMLTNHYYPFGLTTDPTMGTPPPGTLIDDHHQYQGKEMDRRDKLYLFDFEARRYDPQLGRFSSLDAMSQFPSGYTGMGNNPVALVDPSGNQTGQSTSASTQTQQTTSQAEFPDISMFYTSPVDWYVIDRRFRWQWSLTSVYNDLYFATFMNGVNWTERQFNQAGGDYLRTKDARDNIGNTITGVGIAQGSLENFSKYSAKVKPAGVPLADLGNMWSLYQAYRGDISPNQAMADMVFNIAAAHGGFYGFAACLTYNAGKFYPESHVTFPGCPTCGTPYTVSGWEGLYLDALASVKFWGPPENRYNNQLDAQYIYNPIIQNETMGRLDKWTGDLDPIQNLQDWWNGKK